MSLDQESPNRVFVPNGRPFLSNDFADIIICGAKSIMTFPNGNLKGVSNRSLIIRFRTSSTLFSSRHWKNASIALVATSMFN